MNNKLRVITIFLIVGMVGARVERAQADPGGFERQSYELALPGKDWVIELKLPSSFAIGAPEISSDGERAKLSGSDQTTGLQLSLFLEKAATEGDANVAREHYWKRMQASPFKMEDVRFSERNGAAFLEYIVKEANWKNMHMYLSHAGYWMDLHISKILFRSTDKDHFDAVLNSIRIVSSQQGLPVVSDSRKPYSLTLPQRGTLILTIPNSWKRSVKKSDKGLPPTILLSPRKGGAFETMITPLWSPHNDQNFNNAAALKWAIEQHLKKMLPTAIEEDVPIQEFSAVDGPGYYFLVTDKAPKPGEYPYAVLALVGVGDLVLNVTILCKEKESEGIAETIRMLQEARQDK